MKNNKLKLEPNEKRIRQIIEEELKIIPSNFKEELISYKIPNKGFSNRSISSLITKTNSYPIEKYQELAFILNQLFEKKNIKSVKKISAEELYIATNSKLILNVKKSRAVLTKVDNSNDLPRNSDLINRSILYNEFTPIGHSIDYIEGIFKGINNKNKIDVAYQDGYSGEIKKSEQDMYINDLLGNLISLYDIHLYASTLIIPLLSLDYNISDWKDQDESVKVKSSFQLCQIPIFLFTKELEHDPLITYSHAYSFKDEEECSNFVKKNSIEKNIDSKLFSSGDIEQYYSVCHEMFTFYKSKFNKLIPYRFLRSAAIFEYVKPLIKNEINLSKKKLNKENVNKIEKKKV